MFPLQFGRSSHDERNEGAGVSSAKKRRKRDPLVLRGTLHLRLEPAEDLCERLLGLSQHRPARYIVLAS